MKLSLVALLLFTCCSCSSSWERSELPTGTTVNDVLAVNVFSPYTLSQLMQPGAIFTTPTETGSSKSGRDYVNWVEYDGDRGRIRVLDEAFERDGIWEGVRWLELYPGTLYLDRTISKKYPSLRLIKETVNGKPRLLPSTTNGI